MDHAEWIFKKSPNKYVERVPDQLGSGGYEGLRSAASNNQNNQRSNSVAWAQDELWRWRPETKTGLGYTTGIVVREWESNSDVC